MRRDVAERAVESHLVVVGDEVADDAACLLDIGRSLVAECAPTTTNLDGPDSLAGGPCSSRFKGGWLWLGR